MSEFKHIKVVPVWKEVEELGKEVIVGYRILMKYRKGGEWSCCKHCNTMEEVQQYLSNRKEKQFES